MRDDYHVWITVDVRWGDMDAFGHVNNAKYFTYCESARIRYFEELDLEAYREHESHGPAVVSATCNFIRQVHYPATLDVGVRAAKIGRSSFTLDYVILRPPFLVEEPARGDLNLAVNADSPKGTMATYADFASFVLDQVEGDDYLNATVGITTDRQLQWGENVDFEKLAEQAKKDREAAAAQ